MAMEMEADFVLTVNSLQCSLTELSFAISFVLEVVKLKTDSAAVSHG